MNIGKVCSRRELLVLAVLEAAAHKVLPYRLCRSPACCDRDAIAASLGPFLIMAGVTGAAFTRTREAVVVVAPALSYGCSCRDAQHSRAS